MVTSAVKGRGVNLNLGVGGGFERIISPTLAKSNRNSSLSVFDQVSAMEDPAKEKDGEGRWVPSL